MRTRSKLRPLAVWAVGITCAAGTPLRAGSGVARATGAASMHAPIVYPVELTAHASPEAATFEAFLEGGAARQIFVRYGFERLLRTSRSGSR